MAAICEEFWPQLYDSITNDGPMICSYFGCKHVLTLEEKLCGDKCQLHSQLPDQAQPHGPQDPVKFISI